MAKSSKKSRTQKKLSYFLDHSQIKRNHSWGNGMVPSAPIASSAAPQASGNKKGSLAEMINFGGNNDKK